MTKSKLFLLIFIIFLALTALVLTFLPKPTPQKPDNQPLPHNFPISLENESKNIFQNYLEKSTEDNFSTPNSPQWQRLPLKEDIHLSLDEFSTATELNIQNELNAVLIKNDFDLFYCNTSNGEKNYGLMLNIKLMPEKTNTYDYSKSLMLKWESTMLKDTSRILFPNIDPLELEKLNKDLQFKDGKYRYAEIILPNGKKSSLNYGIAFDSIILTTSFECMDKAYKETETLEP